MFLVSPSINQSNGGNMKRCKEKRRFKKLCEAMRAADRYMEEKVLVLNPMVPYRCYKHSCFHIGHNRWMSDNKIRSFTVHSRERTRALDSSTEKPAAPAIRAYLDMLVTGVAA